MTSPVHEWRKSCALFQYHWARHAWCAGYAAGDNHSPINMERYTTLLNAESRTLHDELVILQPPRTDVTITNQLWTKPSASLPLVGIQPLRSAFQCHRPVAAKVNTELSQSALPTAGADHRTREYHRPFLETAL